MRHATLACGAVLALALACSSDPNGRDRDDDDAGSSGRGAGEAGSSSGRAGSGGVPGGGASGRAGAAGSTLGSGGATAGSAGSANAGSATAGNDSAGTGGASGGTAGAGGTTGGSGGDGGRNMGGAGGTGGEGAGRGGAGGSAGSDGGAGGSSGLAGTGGRGGTGGAGGACPASGDITYTLSKASSPSADEAEAYELITLAMDEALEYYNCYTNVSRMLSISYNPSVQTADGNPNGSIRFGSNRSYMNYITAMHETSHVLGVGSNEWDAMIVDGVFTGPAATAELREITGDPEAMLNGDLQHFWPYGLNFTSEVMGESDLLNHLRLVVAIRKDLGFDD